MQRRLPADEAELPFEKYLLAQEHMRKMRRYTSAQEHFLSEEGEPTSQTVSSTGAASWTPLGPGNIGGRTRALLLHPTTPTTMYAAAASGGVWKTTDGGKLWQPLTDLLPSLLVNALAFDPKNPEVIYAGTGESFASLAFKGAGILKTSDGGAHWTRLTATATTDFEYVNDLVVSPNDSRRVYAATTTGVWRSEDGGASWARSLARSQCDDLVMRTDHTSDTLLVAVREQGRGAVWRHASGVWTEVLSNQNVGRISLALAPSNQDIVYATGDERFAAVFRSTTGGTLGSWQVQSRGNQVGKVSPDFGGQGFYNNVTAVDPLDHRRVWVGGLGLYRSDDSGVTWGWANSHCAKTNEIGSIHLDQHVIAFHPQFNGTTNQIMIVGNDGGIYRTDFARAPAAGLTPPPCTADIRTFQWTLLNNNYSVSQFYAGLPFPDGKRYLGGTQDNGTPLGSDLGGLNGWRAIGSDDGGYVAVDFSNPYTLYFESQFFNFRKSLNGGLTSSLKNAGVVGSFVTPFVMDPNDPQRLWAGGLGLSLSTDGANRWQLAAQSQPVTQVTAIAVAPANSNFVIAGFANGTLLRTSNALAPHERRTWASSKPREGYLSGLAYDPVDPQIVYATYSTFGGAHVWRSRDAGATWASLDGTGTTGLPDIPVHCLVVDPQDSARLYIGTDLGIFVSLDGGARWAVENTGFPNVITESLAFNTEGDLRLFAFTHGRGAWRVDVTNACQFNVGNFDATVNAAGGAGSLNITASGSGCRWRAFSGSEWISLGSSGSGSGALTLNVATNPSFTPRSGAIWVAGRRVVVTQAAQVDNTPPVIRVTSPLLNGVFRVTQASFAFSGTVTDDREIVEMRWESDRLNTAPRNQPDFFAVTVSGTTWKIAAPLTLPLGVTNFTVTARDVAGNQASTSFAVNYEPEQMIVTVAGIGYPDFRGDGGAARSAALNNPNGLALDAAGNLYIADTWNNRIRKVTVAGIISTVAGTGVGEFGGDGGPATAAKLNYPTAVSLDQTGNLLIADAGNLRIRKLALATGIITTLATLPGSPRGMAVDSANQLYVAEPDAHLIRKVSPTGVLSVYAGNGTAGFSGDNGLATAAQLYSPNDVAVDISGNVYIADTRNHVIRQVTRDGKISTLAGAYRDNDQIPAFVDGVPATTAKLYFPSGVAVDAAGNLYIADTSNHFLHKVTRGLLNRVAGTLKSSNSGGFNGDGLPSLTTDLNYPRDMVISVTGEIYFIDGGNHLVRKLAPYARQDVTPPVIRIGAPTTESNFTTAASQIVLSGGASDNSALAQIQIKSDVAYVQFSVNSISTSWAWTANAYLRPGVNLLTATAWDTSGNSSSATLTVNFQPDRVRLSAVTNLAALPGLEGLPPTNARWGPQMLALDSAGTLYFAETFQHRIRKLTREGVVSTVAGTGRAGFSGDGGAATQARLYEPRGIALDAAGNLYIADTLNHRIRKVTPAGIISTLAGTGAPGFAVENGSALSAQLLAPTGIAVDAAGQQVFFSDTGNHRVRRIANGAITTVAGNGTAGLSGDGSTANIAQLNTPQGLALAANGALFIADAGNGRVRLVQGGQINSFGPVQGEPYGLALDADGNLLVADAVTAVIWRITPSGTASRWIERSLPLYATDDGSPIPVALGFLPVSVALDRSGNLYFADQAAHNLSLVTAYRAASAVSAASYSNEALSPDSIAAVFGAALATGTQVANTVPLPFTLAGSHIRLRDALGVERLAPLFFVSPGQANFLIPSDTAYGLATLSVTSSDGKLTSGIVPIAATAPALFAANANGQGVAAAVALRIKADGTQQYEAVAQFDAAMNKYLPRALTFGLESEQLYLVMFGSGLRRRAASVTATVGEVTVPVLYAGAQGSLLGVDQINLSLPRSLRGRGLVTVKLFVDGKTTNAVQISL